MKKLNKILLGSILVVSCFTAVATFVSCKTIPAGKVVDPINLLDEKSDFYLAIPKKADPQLIERIVNKNIPGLPDKNVQMICDRTTKIYSGISRSKTKTEIQSAIEGTIPTNLIPKLLTKKNGWTIKEFTPEGAIIPHIVYNANNLDVSFPATNVVCIGRDMGYMLNQHDKLSIMPENLPLIEEPTDEYFSPLPRQIYDYLKGADSEIRFYANNPLSFLTILLGSNLDLKLVDVQGAFTVDPNRDDQYFLEIQLKFRETKFLKAGKALLGLAFGLTNSQSEVLDDSILKLSGIRISKNMLYKILLI